jgi:hypothetical protein
MVYEYRGSDFRHLRRRRCAPVKRSGCRQIRTQLQGRPTVWQDRPRQVDQRLHRVRAVAESPFALEWEGFGRREVERRHAVILSSQVCSPFSASAAYRKAAARP